MGGDDVVNVYDLSQGIALATFKVRWFILSYELNSPQWKAKDKPVGGDDVISVYNLSQGIALATFKVRIHQFIRDIPLHLVALINFFMSQPAINWENLDV